MVTSGAFLTFLLFTDIYIYFRFVFWPNPAGHLCSWILLGLGGATQLHWQGHKRDKKANFHKDAVFCFPEFRVKPMLTQICYKKAMTAWKDNGQQDVLSLSSSAFISFLAANLMPAKEKWQSGSLVITWGNWKARGLPSLAKSSMEAPPLNPLHWGKFFSFICLAVLTEQNKESWMENMNLQ